MCLTSGADIIDCKEPNAGALGALPAATVADIRHAVPLTTPVSATVGDVPPDPAEMLARVEAMAATGVDFVKIGIFPGGNAKAAIAAMGKAHVGQARLVGLLLADLEPDFRLIDAMAEAGFAGVMVDTAGKSGRALPDVMSQAQMAAFIAHARRLGLFAGLAGSLRSHHIAALKTLNPDLLGFRGALCQDGDRRGELDRNAITGVRQSLSQPAMAGLQRDNVAT